MMCGGIHVGVHHIEFLLSVVTFHEFILVTEVCRILSVYSMHRMLVADDGKCIQQCSAGMVHLSTCCWYPMLVGFNNSLGFTIN